MSVTLTQYSSTLYWGIIITFNLLLVLFITMWLHINTMTKRQERLEALLRKLDKRLDETIDEIADIPVAPTQPPQQFFVPVQPMPVPQQSQGPYQPPTYPQ